MLRIRDILVRIRIRLTNGSGSSYFPQWSFTSNSLGIRSYPDPAKSFGSVEIRIHNTAGVAFLFLILLFRRGCQNLSHVEYCREHHTGGWDILQLFLTPLPSLPTQAHPTPLTPGPLTPSLTPCQDPHQCFPPLLPPPLLPPPLIPPPHLPAPLFSVFRVSAPFAVRLSAATGAGA